MYAAGLSLDAGMPWWQMLHNTENALQRTPDAAGEAQYVRALASGQFSRADLLAAFSDSQEHINLVAQRTAARDAAGFNLDLSPHLGIIPVINGPAAT